MVLSRVANSDQVYDPASHAWNSEEANDSRLRSLIDLAQNVFGLFVDLFLIGVGAAALFGLVLVVMDPLVMLLTFTAGMGIAAAALYAVPVGGFCALSALKRISMIAVDLFSLAFPEIGKKVRTSDGFTSFVNFVGPPLLHDFLYKAITPKEATA